jgi:hypothetical protein
LQRIWLTGVQAEAYASEQAVRKNEIWRYKGNGARQTNAASSAPFMSKRCASGELGHRQECLCY